MIGRQVYPLLDAAGFCDVRVGLRMVYVDASRPHRVEGFTRKTFTAMIEGIGPTAISAGLVGEVHHGEHATSRHGVAVRSRPEHPGRVDLAWRPTKRARQLPRPFDAHADTPHRCCGSSLGPRRQEQATGRVILRGVLRVLALPFRLAQGVVDVVRRGGTSQSLPGRSPSTEPPVSPPPSRGRARKYDEALTQLVARRPGVTVAESAQELGVDATALYPPIRRLEAIGALVKVGRELHPPR